MTLGGSLQVSLTAQNITSIDDWPQDFNRL